MSHLREMDSESTYLSLCSDAHFHQSPVVDQLEFKQTSCSNPHQDLGQIEITVPVISCPTVFMMPRTSVLLFFHRGPEIGLRSAQKTGVDKCIQTAGAPCFDRSKRPRIVHGQSALCFVGFIAEPKVDS